MKNLHPTKQRADDFVGGQVSLKPVFKAVKWREDDALIGCAGECCARKAYKCDGVRYAGRFPCDFLGLPDNSVSAIQRGAVRQLYNNDGVTLVAFWNEACRRRLQNLPGREKQPAEQCKHEDQHAPRTDKETDDAAIDIGQRIKCAVEAAT